MWRRKWLNQFVHPADADVIDAIEERPFPEWFVDTVHKDLRHAARIVYLHVDTTTASTPLGVQTGVAWPGLIDRQGRTAQSIADLRLYWYDGRLYVGFENGPEPVLLWEWK